MNLDKLYMDIAINKALESKGFQKYNPKVGCLILKNNTILGTGYHQTFGKGHAEVNAIEDAKKKVSSLTGTTMYVTLSPCSKIGKTGSCVQLIIKNKIKKIYIGSLDTSDNDGIKKLKAAGIKVVLLNSQRAKDINVDFFYNINHKKPYVAIKIASTIDGFSATKTLNSKWITSQSMRLFSRKQRSEFQSILIGLNTLKLDNPLLTTRVNKYRNPIIIICAPDLFDWTKYDLFKSQTKKIIFVKKSIKTPKIPHVQFIKMNSYPFHPQEILKLLWRKNIKSILIEGGSSTQNIFLKYNCVNEVNIYYGNKIMADTKAMNIFNFKSVNNISELKPLKLLDHKVIDNQIYTKWGLK